MLRVVERTANSVKLVQINGKVHLIVHEKPDSVASPFNRIDRHSVFNIRNANGAALGTVRMLSFSLAVNGSVYNRRLKTNVFHDVDFSRQRVRRARPHSPNCGPDALSLRELGANFNATVLPFVQTSGMDAAGSVLRFDAIFFVRFFNTGNDELAVFLTDVFRSFIGIELFLVIANKAMLVFPVSGIDVAGSVELVVPNQLERFAFVRFDRLRNRVVSLRRLR